MPESAASYNAHTATPRFSVHNIVGNTDGDGVGVRLGIVGDRSDTSTIDRQ